MARFVDLPREVRNQIYHYCLVVQGEILIYDEGYCVPKEQQARPPSLNLTAVNKLIRTEALEVLYRKNVWIMGNDPHCINYEDHPWVLYGKLFRHVVLYFNRFDIDEEEAYIIHKPPHREHWRDDQDRLSSTHRRNEMDALLIMEYKRNCLRELTALSSITFDVESLLCLGGCCRDRILKRMLRVFLDKSLLREHQRHVYEDIHVTVRGIWNEEEVRLVRERMPFAEIEMHRS